MIANSLLGQEMWIEHRNYPGGPVAYWTDNGAVWYNVLGSAADMFGNFMGDALLVGVLLYVQPKRVPIVCLQLYRLFIIYSGSRYIVIFPCMIFLASTGEFDWYLIILLL